MEKQQLKTLILDAQAELEILFFGKNRGAIAIDSGVEIGLYFSHSHMTCPSLNPTHD